jgi:DNA-binding transcriptional regulator LsrR (DeoR family)
MNHGYTQKEIADYLGIYHTTVSKVIVKMVPTKK